MIARQLSDQHHGMILRHDRTFYGIKRIEHTPSQAVLVTVIGTPRPLILSPNIEIEVTP